MDTPLPVQDSTNDTLDHIARVHDYMRECAWIILNRGNEHDRSKLQEPEKSGFDRLMALKLSGMPYGSEEYRACLRAEKPAIDHHYAHNSHHAEHYPEGIDGMCLFDLIEMLMDWKAASERMQNGGDIYWSLEHNIERFKISPQLANILLNTIKRMEWKRPVANET